MWFKQYVCYTSLHCSDLICMLPVVASGWPPIKSACLSDRHVLDNTNFTALTRVRDGMRRRDPRLISRMVADMTVLPCLDFAKICGGSSLQIITS